MPLETGAVAPELPVAGGRPVLLAFFKNNCPTCQLSFPVWGELARRHGEAVDVVAVAQDPEAAARPWLDERDFPGPVVDDSDGYPLSDAFEVDTVPSLALVDADGRVVAAAEGWDRDRANRWDEQLAGYSGRTPEPVSRPDDGRPDFKPG